MKSMFGYEGSSTAANLAYDMMVLDQIDKDEKELALRKLYGADRPDLTGELEDEDV